MTQSLFQAPSIQSMNQLLPAFEFISILSVTNDQAIYVAVQKSLDRHVAIKLHAPQLTHDADFREAFETMARQMAKLNHVNLVGVFNSGVVDGMLYMVMEHVPGRVLSTWVAGKALELSQAVSIMSGICAGLAHAHASGVLHGGLSMPNILINQQLEPKIDNFGFVDSASSDGHDPSSRFLAPELWEPGGGLTALSDVYSLGAIFYELVTGQPYGPNAKPAHLVIPVDQKVSALCAKATSKNPAERPASVAEFREALEKFGPKKKAGAAGLSRKNKGAARPAGVGPAPVLKEASNTKLIVHIVVIIVLIFAIRYVWNTFHTRDAKTIEVSPPPEKVQEQIVNITQSKEREHQRQRRERRKREAGEDTRQQQASTQQQDQQEKPKDETPSGEKKVLESLHRLHKALLAGERVDMPEGSKAIGSTTCLLVPTPMTWTEASWFAEQYGAHLVVPDADANFQWLQSEMLGGSGQVAWIGAASNGRDTWALASGAPFAPPTPPEKDGHYLALGGDGKLIAEQGEAKHPFILQWCNDGTHPYHLAALLKRTGASAKSKPVYPPGTVAYGLRHYMHVRRDVDWKTASELARLAGGHLMVIRGAAESYNLKRMVTNMPAGENLWAGASMKDGNWAWVTKEPWDKIEWADANATVPSVAALWFRTGRGYEAVDPAQKASGFIIEWSRDAASVKP